MGVWIETLTLIQGDCFDWSHPAWVCGLKQVLGKAPLCDRSHTLRGCVDWNLVFGNYFLISVVTPCVGVWIETIKFSCVLLSSLSHPAWVCGLKPQITLSVPFNLSSHTLRGCVDWNKKSNRCSRLGSVTPCVGVWIETKKLFTAKVGEMSHPAWVCGLKLMNTIITLTAICHTLRGCVDWNWASVDWSRAADSHTLRGCVDWNSGLYCW